MDGRVLAWNEAAWKLFAKPPWRAIGAACAALVRGYTPDGEPLCGGSCPMLEQLKQGVSPMQMAMVVLTGRPPFTRLAVSGCFVRMKMSSAAMGCRTSLSADAVDPRGQERRLGMRPPPRIRPRARESLPV